MSEGPDITGWLVSKTSGFLGARLSRRSFISRATIMGTAVAASGCAVVTQPGAPITFVTDCRSGLCRDGYTEFCCVINSGMNACPPNTAAAGWWRADSSVYCGGGTRYYIDCNNWTGEGGPCRCADGCGTRRVFCNNFRYGQCNTQIGGTGTIACRMVTCVPPYQLDIGCGNSGAVDNATANHNADCAAYTPAPAPPPLPPVVPVPAAPSVGSGVVTGAGLLSVFGRVTTSAVEQWDFNGTVWSSPPATLTGDVASKVEAVASNGVIDLFARSTSHTLLTQRFAGGAWSGWADRAGEITSDPAAVVLGSQHFVIVRGNDDAFYVSVADDSSPSPTWSAYQGLGGTLSSDPAAVVLGSEIFVFGRGGGRLFVNTYSGSWSGWYYLDGWLTSDPAAAVLGSSVYAFGRGIDNGCYAIQWNGSAWSAWSALGGKLTSEPAAVAAGSNLFLFARLDDNVLWYSALAGGTWTDWAPLGRGVSIQSDPEVVSDGTKINVFVQLSDGTLGVLHFDGTVWDRVFTSLGGDDLAPVAGTSA